MIRTQPTISIKETFATVKSNKPLAYLCGSSFFYLIGVFAVGGTTAFYAQYVLGNIGLVGIITLVNTGITLLITPFIPKIIDMFGKKNVFQYCGVFTIVGGVGLFFAPANMFWLVLLTLAIKGIGASLINTVMFGLEADTVEYGEWKTGRRSEGATYALFSFTRKVTQSLGGAVGAWALAIGGYVAASAANPNPVQPESAIIAIKATIGLLPAACALIAMIIFIKYPLTDEGSSRSVTRPRPASWRPSKPTTRIPTRSSPLTTRCDPDAQVRPAPHRGIGQDVPTCTHRPTTRRAGSPA